MSQAAQAFVRAAADDSNAAVSVGVQSWSRGDIFPAVIGVIETYAAPMTFAEWQNACTQVAHHELANFLHEQYVKAFYQRELSERLISHRYLLQYPGRKDGVYGTYDIAAFMARSYIAHDAAPCLGDGYGVPFEDADAADRYARRTYFSYTPEQIAAGEMVGGSPVSTRNYQ